MYLRQRKVDSVAINYKIDKTITTSDITVCFNLFHERTSGFDVLLYVVSFLPAVNIRRLSIP